MKGLSLYFTMVAIVGAMFLFECTSQQRKPYYISISNSARSTFKGWGDTILMQWREDTQYLYTSSDSPFIERITKFIVVDTLIPEDLILSN
jgi:hypothetical protein